MSKGKKEKEKGVFDLIDGLTPVDPKALTDFMKEMTEQVIPEIVRVMDERLMLAAQSRNRHLKGFHN
jgi:hypothetical protein